MNVERRDLVIRLLIQVLLQGLRKEHTVTAKGENAA